MNPRAMANVRKASRARAIDTRLVADRIFALALILALFAAEIAVVQFAGRASPPAVDGQTYMVPIT